MKIYILKRRGKNNFANLNFSHILEVGGKNIGWAGLYFFQKKVAKEALKQYDGEYGNPFVIWEAELKEDKQDNRKR